jgi:NAD(P)H-nitrite reductase large subunit
MRGNRWWRYALSLEGAEIMHDGLRSKGVTPVFESGVERFETGDDGHVEATVDPNEDRYDSEWVGVAIGLDFNTEFLRGTGVELDGGIVVDEYMRTDVEDVYAAGDLTQFYDTILDRRAQNGSWGSAKQQGKTAAKNMAAGDAVEPFRWVSSYSVTHFDFPFLSFGHPTEGDEYCQRRYNDTDFRRIAFREGKIVGGVLIGDLAPQTTFKKLMRNERVVVDQQEKLLAERVDADEIAPAAEQ